MLLDQLSSRLLSGILRFLWRQWSQLGVAADVEFRDRWVIDPEALLLFTLEAGRYDPRLFDEVLDWCVRNARWLSVQRLKNLADRQDSEVAQRVLRAFLEFMGEHDLSGRWRTLGGADAVPSGESLPLFLDVAGRELPALGATEPTFAKHGVLRPAVKLRHMSRPVPVDYSTNLIFKLRALFGVGARPEVVAYLLTHPDGYPSQVARCTAYSAPSVQQVMSDLADSGLVAVRQIGREKMYSANRERWYPFLRRKGLPGSPPRWVEWPMVFIGLSRLVIFFHAMRLDQPSEYMLQSRLVSLMDTLVPVFADSGLAVEIPVGFRGNAKSFSGFVIRLIAALNRGPTRGFPRSTGSVGLSSAG